MLVETVVSVDGIELASVSTTTTSQTSNRQKELADDNIYFESDLVQLETLIFTEGL